MKRIAVLYDENGKEIFRGAPAAMPVRFEEASGEVVEWSMAQAVNAGTPIDSDTGDDLELYLGDDYAPSDKPLLEQIQDVLYPEGDWDTEWTPDTLEAIAEIMQRYRPRPE